MATTEAGNSEKKSPHGRKKTVSVKCDPALAERLEKALANTGMDKADLVRKAIEAAVTAIENDGGKLVLPLNFITVDMPQPRKSRRKK